MQATALAPPTPYDHRWATLAVLCLSLLMVVMDNTILNVALPSIATDLDASSSELTWIVDAYSLLFAGLLLTFGALGDRFGRQGVLNLGLITFGVASAASVFATAPEHLIFTRALMGTAAALIMPATLSILTNVFTDRKERAQAIAIWSGLAGAGVAIGPITGGWLLENFDWNAIFVLNLPLVAVALAAGRLFVPTSRDPEKPSVDVAGAVLSTAGLISLVYGIIEAPESGWTSTIVLASFAAAAITLAAFVIHELRTSQPMLNLQFFRNARFSA
ncbi:MAG TPA: MFS transporter, partial [Rubrobacter sp.]|nr:MFS transporter [Rubrobacter sp.]